jgi:hypothetical protein
MLDAQPGRLIAHFLVADSRNQANVLRRSAGQELAELSPVGLVGLGNFAEQQIGIETITEKSVSLRTSARLDHPVASSLESHLDQGARLRILNYSQDKQKCSHNASFESASLPEHFSQPNHMAHVHPAGKT